MKLASTIHRFDVSVSIWLMKRKRHALFARVGRWVSRSGDGYLYAALALYLFVSGVLWAWSPDNRVFLVGILAAFAFERSLYFVLKNSLKRHRPQEALENFRSVIKPSDRFSFPSGHTSGAFLMATFVAYFHPALAIPAYVWASSLGLSRLVLGVHFPTDVVAGMTMGTTVAAVTLHVLA